MGAAPAIILRKQRDIVEVYQGARATTPETARDPDELGIDRGMVFNGLVRRAVLREAGTGRFYLDEPSWKALNGMRRRVALAIVAVLVLSFGSLLLLR